MNGNRSRLCGTRAVILAGSGLMAVVLMMLLGASPAQAAEIGGRTYGTTSLGAIDSDYSFTNVPPPTHTWGNVGAADTWSSLVTVDGANGAIVDINRVNMNVTGGSLTGGVVNMNQNFTGSSFNIGNLGVLRVAKNWSFGSTASSVTNGGQLRFTADGSGWTSAGGAAPSLTVSSNATLAVDHSGTTTFVGLLNDLTFLDIQAGAIVTIANNGTFNVSARTLNFLGDTTLAPGATLNLRRKPEGGNQGSPTVGGNWTLGAGSKAILGGGNVVGTTISGTTPLVLSGSGTLVVTNYPLTITSPSTLTIPSTMTLQLDAGAGLAGTVKLQGVANVNAAMSGDKVEVQNGGVLNMKMNGNWSMNTGNSLDVTNGGQLRFTEIGSGIYLGNGKMQVLAGGTLAVDHSGNSTISTANAVWGALPGFKLDFANGATIALTNGGSLVTSNLYQLFFNGAEPGGNLGVNILNNGGVLDIAHKFNATGGVATPIVFTNLLAGTTLDMRGAGAKVQFGATDLLQNSLATVNGTLLVSNGFSLTPGGGTLTVKNGGKLGGSGGTIAGIVKVESGGILAPGNSPGILSVGSLDLDHGAFTNLEIKGLVRGTDYDGMNVLAGGAVDFDGILNLAFGNTNAFFCNTFDLFNFNTSSTGDFDSVISTGFYPGTWTKNGEIWSLPSQGVNLLFSEITGDLFVTPEPSSLALLGLAALALLRRRNRRA